MKLTESDARIINEFLKTGAKVAHYKGEPFTGATEDKIAVVYDDAPTTESFIYTGEYTKAGWLIKYIPKDLPTWNVGDWAYYEQTGVCKLKSTNNAGGFIVESATSGDKCNVSRYDLRPLTDADWTGHIGKVAVRAYENDRKAVIFTISEPFSYLDGSDFVKREICRAFNIPIMPFPLHRGEYKRPEEP